MNDSTNDNGTSDATEGILADLADLQESANAARSADHQVDDKVREELDSLADAAGSLRENPDEDGEDSRPRSRRVPKRAREAVANRGLVFEEPATAGKVCAQAFGNGLLAETSGPSDEVVKLLPPLTISHDDLDQGLGILTDSVKEVIG